MRLKNPSTPPPSRSVYVAGIVAAALLTLVLLVWLWPRNRSSSPLPEDGPELVLEGFSEEQQKKMREGRHKTMTEWVAGYYELPEDLRPVYLDKVIDEQQEQLQRWGGAYEDAMMEGTATQATTRSAAEEARLAEFSRALTERYRERDIEVPLLVVPVDGEGDPEPGT